MGCFSSNTKDDFDKKLQPENNNNLNVSKNKEIEEKYLIIKPSQIIDGIDVYENQIQEILETLNSIKLCPKCQKIFNDNELNEISNLLDKLKSVSSIDEDIKELRSQYYFNNGNYHLFGNAESLEKKNQLGKLIDEKVNFFNSSLNVDKIITCTNINCNYKMRFRWKILRKPIGNPFIEIESDEDSI